MRRDPYPSMQRHVSKERKVLDGDFATLIFARGGCLTPPQSTLQRVLVLRSFGPVTAPQLSHKNHKDSTEPLETTHVCTRNKLGRLTSASVTKTAEASSARLTVLLLAGRRILALKHGMPTTPANVISAFQYFETIFNAGQATGLPSSMIGTRRSSDLLLYGRAESGRFFVSPLSLVTTNQSSAPSRPWLQCRRLYLIDFCLQISDHTLIIRQYVTRSGLTSSATPTEPQKVNL